jgi:hypothetical protein
MISQQTKQRIWWTLLILCIVGYFFLPNPPPIAISLFSGGVAASLMIKWIRTELMWRKQAQLSKSPESHLSSSLKWIARIVTAIVVTLFTKDAIRHLL